MIFKIIIVVILLWHIGIFIFHWIKENLKDAYEYAKIRWIDLFHLLKEFIAMLIAFIVFGIVTLIGILYTTLKHIIKGDYSLSKQLKPILKALKLASDGIANTGSGEMLNDYNKIPKNSKIKYGTWYQTISAVTGILNKFRLSCKFGSFIDKILGKNHCEDAITKEQKCFYLNK